MDPHGFLWPPTNPPPPPKTTKPNTTQNRYALRLRPAPDDTGYYYSNYRPRLSDLRCALAAAMSEEVNAPAHAPAPTGGGGEEEGGEPHQAQPTQPAAAAAAGAEEEEGQQQSPQAQPQPQSTAGGGAGVVVMPGSLAVVELSPNPFRWGRGEEAVSSGFWWLWA